MSNRKLSSVQTDNDSWYIHSIIHTTCRLNIHISVWCRLGCDAAWGNNINWGFNGYVQHQREIVTSHVGPRRSAFVFPGICNLQTHSTRIRMPKNKQLTGPDNAPDNYVWLSSSHSAFNRRNNANYRRATIITQLITTLERKFYADDAHNAVTVFVCPSTRLPVCLTASVCPSDSSAVGPTVLSGGL